MGTMRRIPTIRLKSMKTPANHRSECTDQLRRKPTVNWVNFGKGFFVQSCRGCHYSEAPYRYGAPEEIIFDDVDDVWDQKRIVLAVSAAPCPPCHPTVEHGYRAENARVGLLAHHQAREGRPAYCFRIILWHNQGVRPGVSIRARTHEFDSRVCLGEDECGNSF